MIERARSQVGGRTQASWPTRGPLPRPGVGLGLRRPLPTPGPTPPRKGQTSSNPRRCGFSRGRTLAGRARDARPLHKRGRTPRCGVLPLAARICGPFCVSGRKGVHVCRLSLLPSIGVTGAYAASVAFVVTSMRAGAEGHTTVADHPNAHVLRGHPVALDVAEPGIDQLDAELPHQQQEVLIYRRNTTGDGNVEGDLSSRRPAACRL